MEKSQSWSIIVFAYNEAGNITSVIDKALSVLKRISKHNFEVIIVDDGSIDGTSEIVDNYYSSIPEIKIIHHDKNIGIGQALISGYNCANYENICAIPADGQFNIEELLPFAFVPHDTMVSFFRKEKIRYSSFRKLVSAGNKWFNRYLLGIKIKDVNWIKIYKKKFLDEIPRVLTSSLVESEICAKVFLSNVKIIEVESDYIPRKFGKSKGASLFVLTSAIKEMIKLIIEINRYKKENKI